jgi:hypothetical protein
LVLKGNSKEMKFYDGLSWVITGCIAQFTSWLDIKLTVFTKSFEVPGIAFILAGFVFLFMAVNFGRKS